MPLATPTRLPMPPGFAGQIALYFYEASPRPLDEAAIAATLGFLAGVCGGAHTVTESRMGLNLFVILLALSGMGKEGLHRVNHLLRVACDLGGGPEFKDALDFVVPVKSVSGAALSRRLAKQPCFVQVLGEIGRKIDEMSKANTSSPLYGLMTLMTELFEQSGPDSFVTGTEYSDTSKNIQPVQGAAYSAMGESTPETFYGALTPSTIENGFLSRWTAIECTGTIKPELNRKPVTTPPQNVLDGVRCMLYHCVRQLGKPVHISYSPDAEEALEAFLFTCDDAVNRAGRDAAKRAIWNRSHAKACRIAALLACADYYAAVSQPVDVNRPRPSLVILDTHAAWAVRLETLNALALEARLDGGDVGDGDDARQAKLTSIIKDYLTNKSLGSSYDVDPNMQRDHMVPRKYLQIRTARQRAFSSHPFGTVRALNEAIQNLCDSGYIVEVDKTKAGESYGYQGRCYKVVNLPRSDT
jgi:hypothetical protein